MRMQNNGDVAVHRTPPLPSSPVRANNWPLLIFILYTFAFIGVVVYLDLGRFVHVSAVQQYFDSATIERNTSSSYPIFPSTSPTLSPSTIRPVKKGDASTVKTKKCPSSSEVFRVRRIEDNNPIISSSLKNMEGDRGANINGPSLLYVPRWVKQPLGRYYLYFGHHSGRDIRLAYSNDLNGPWRVLEEGCLSIDETPGPMGHIASPEVLVDHSTKQIKLYFHGYRSNRENELDGGGSWPQYPQITLLAVSSDGLSFQVVPTPPLAPPYLRVFQWGGYFYGLAKDLDNGGLLLRSPDGIQPFESGASIINRMRHAALLVCDDSLYIFFSRLWDEPERLLYTRLQLSLDNEIDNAWRDWEEEEPIELLKSERDWEGSQLPVEPGNPGGAYSAVHALRDPFVFLDPRSDSLFLLYSTKGEKAIAIAHLEVVPKQEEEESSL